MPIWIYGSSYSTPLSFRHKAWNRSEYFLLAARNLSAHQQVQVPKHLLDLDHLLMQGLHVVQLVQQHLEVIQWQVAPKDHQEGRLKDWEIEDLLGSMSHFPEPALGFLSYDPH